MRIINHRPAALACLLQSQARSNSPPREILVADGDSAAETAACVLGWGHEDADPAVRLIHAGVTRKEGQFSVLVLRLWHERNPRAPEGENYAGLMATLQGKRNVRSSQGIDSYLPHA
jgi:hypothetical protein